MYIILLVARFCVNSPHAHHILANSKIMALYKNIRPPWIYSPVFTTNACWTTFQSTCLICFRNFWNGDQSQWHFLDGVWRRVTLAEMITHYFRIQQLGGIIAKAYAHTHPQIHIPFETSSFYLAAIPNLLSWRGLQSFLTRNGCLVSGVATRRALRYEKDDILIFILPWGHT